MASSIPRSGGRIHICVRRRRRVGEASMRMLSSGARARTQPRGRVTGDRAFPSVGGGVASRLSAYTGRPCCLRVCAASVRRLCGVCAACAFRCSIRAAPASGHAPYRSAVSIRVRGVRVREADRRYWYSCLLLTDACGAHSSRRIPLPLAESAVCVLCATGCMLSLAC